VVQTITCPGLNTLQATADAGAWFLLWKREGLVAMDDQAHRLWLRASLPTHSVVAGGLVLLTENLDRELVAVNRADGNEQWRFEAPAEGDGESGRRSQVIPAAFPSVTVVGDRVIVLTMNFRVFVLSLATGEVIAQAKPAFPGWYVVTDRSIFFKQAFGLSEFDHRELKEVDRIQYRAEVEPLYKGQQVTVNAFCLSEQSVIWTTMHGALMGVSRKPGVDGRRATWCYEIPGGVMPLAEAPVAYGDYLYFTNKGQEPELLCFESASRSSDGL
jgi:outer membrane protein assembly factor BamB